MERDQIDSQSDPVNLLKKLADIINLNNLKGNKLDIENKSWQGITFLSGETVYIISIEDVVEIIPYPKLMSIPNVKRWLRGITNFRGDILPVSDLQDFMHNQVSSISSDTRVFIVKADNELVGIMVNKIIGLVRVPIDTECITDITESMAAYLKGIYKLDGQDLPWLSIEKIVKNERFRFLTKNIN